MANNRDAGDVNGLEEVFRAQELSRTSGTVLGASDVTAPRTGQEEARVTTEQVQAVTAEAMSPSGGGAAPASDGLALPRTPRPETPFARGAGGTSAGLVATAMGALWRRDSSRYWTIAALGALVALVVVGVTTGTDQHHAPTTSAQGTHGSARPGSGFHTSGAASTGPTAPGSLTGAVGSGALALGAPAKASHGSISSPGGHVTLIGAASITGSAPSSSSAPSGVSSGGGVSGLPPAEGGGNPVAPIAAGVGSTVGTVGSSVTGVANQIVNAVPAAAPAASAVSTVVNAVDQAISTTPF